MNFRAKTREWKRRLVHLLVVVLLINNIYCLPVMAQTDVQELLPAGDVLESVSGGDEVVNDIPEEQTEGEDVQKELSEGNVSENLSGESISVENVVVDTELESQTAMEEAVAEEDTPWGDSAIEIQVGETIYGLTGTDTYEQYDYVGGYWLKMDLTEPGVYNLARTTSGFIRVFDAMGRQHDYTIAGSDSISITVLENPQGIGEAGIYHCYVKGHEDFSVSLTKVPVIKEIEAEVINDYFYYEVIDSYYSLNVADTLKLTLEDGTEVVTDNAWGYDYKIYYEVYDNQGNVAVIDENGKYPIGEYIYRIYQNEGCRAGIGAYCDVPITIVSVEKDAKELTVGGSVTGLSGKSSDEYSEYIGGHWLRFEANEPGNYTLTKSIMGSMTVLQQDGYKMGFGDSLSDVIQIETVGTYYFYVEANEVFDVTLTMNPKVMAINMSVRKDTFYYEWDNLATYSVFECGKIVLEDGTEETFDSWDTTISNKYGINFAIYDKEGNYAQRDDSWKYPVGDYICKAEVPVGGVSFEVPVKVISVEDVATQISLGQQMTGLSGTDTYENHKYEGGHWFKLEIDKPGLYNLTKSAEGTIVVVKPDYTQHNWTATYTHMVMSATETGTYYFYVKGNETFELSIVSVEDVAIPIGVGDTISGLTGAEDCSNPWTGGGHWLKLEVDEPGNYVLTKSADGIMEVSYFNGLGEFLGGGTEGYLQIQEETPYCYVKGSEDFEIALSKQPKIVEIRPVITRNKLYYEIEYMSIHNIISQVELVFDDGTVETCSPYNDVWYKYHLTDFMLDDDGNYAQYDDNGKYPTGNYSFVINQRDNTDVNAEIPIEVVSLDESAVKLVQGEGVSGLMACDNYDSYDYQGGHWFKTELDEGNYLISKNASGMLKYLLDDGSGSGASDTKSLMLTISEPKTCYIYAKGDEAFDIILYSPMEEAIELKVGETIFDLTGTVNYSSSQYLEGHWIKADFEKEGRYIFTKTASGFAETRDPNWNGLWRYDTKEFTIQVSEPGTYCFYVKGNENFDVTIRYLDDMATEMSVGETITGLSPNTDAEDMNNIYNSHIFKVEIEEAGRYEVSKSTNGMTYIEGMGTSSGASWSDVWAINITQPGTYYIYVKGYDTFDFTLVKTPLILEMRANVKKDVVYYEFGSTDIRSIISSLELTLDNGTVVTCAPLDAVWNKYDIYCDFLDKDGNWPQQDESYRYPIGEYKYVLDAIGCDTRCEIPFKIVSITDESVVVPEFPTEPIDLTEVMTQEIYKLDITKTGTYKLDVAGTLNNYSYVYIYDEKFQWVSGYSFNMYQSNLGVLEPGRYYVKFSTYYDVPEGVTIKLARIPELDTLEYNGSDIVWKYGEWGYRLENVVSGNYVSTRALSSNYMLSGNMNLNVSMPIKLAGTLKDGSSISIPFGENMQAWRTYKLSYRIFNDDGTTAYTDRNGYLANGNYLLVVTAGYGGAIAEIPFKVTGGPVVPNSWAYSGATQEIKYGTWGYNMSLVLSGNRVDAPMRPNADLNGMVSGNNVLALDFKVTAKSDDGQTDTVSYGSKAWNLYRIKTYFYDAEGNSVCTDKNGYIPEGTYVMKCVAYNGTEFEIPLKVYKDAGDIAEEQLSTAVDEILTEAEKLTDETLTEATEEEKKTVVQEVLQKVEEIYENQEIAEIGSADADKAIELAEKLVEVEKQIKELLSTSVIVSPQDEQAEDIQVRVKNALLSVPAGENAQIKVTTTEVPENIPVKKENAAAIQLDLVAESEEKMQLNAPVIVTVKVPEGIDTNEEVWVYHFADLQEKAKEIIKAKLNGDGTLSFVTGSFSTFVIANAAKGASVSGVVVSFGDESEEVTVKVLNGDKVVVAETISAAETGAYQFEQLELGEYTLVFSKADHVDREYSITVAEENIVQDATIYLLGDVDGNGKINARDKKTIYNHIAGESELSGYEFQVGDVNSDGKINARDKKMIYNHIAGESLLWQ